MVSEPYRASPSAESTSFDFLSGGGEMGALMRALDWSTLSLGPPADWPQTLRTVVRIMLNTGHPMYIWWGDDCACLYNDAYRESIGPELHPGSLGRPAKEVWAEIWSLIEPQIDQVRSGRGATWHVDHLVPITRYGRREDVYWTYSYSPIDDEASPHGIGGVLVVCTETTKQVHLAHQLSRERDQLAALFEQAPSFMALLRGEDHRIEIANPNYMKLVNHRPVLGKTVAEALPDAVEQGYLKLLDEVFRSGNAYVATGAKYAIQATPNDQVVERYVDFVYQPIFDCKGSVEGIFVEGTDVTERQRAQEALRLSQEQLNDSSERLALAIDAAGLGTFYCPLPFNKIYWNATCKRHFFLPEDADVDSVLFYDRIHPEDRERTRVAVDAAVLNGEAYDIEYRTFSPEGESRWVRAKGQAYFAADGTPTRFDGITIDITRHKEAEQNLLMANRQKDDFLAMLAHELRNPLAPISAAAALLAIPGADPASIQRTANIVARQVKHMSELLNDLLDVSRVTRGMVELSRAPVDIKSVISAAIEQVQPLMEARHHRLEIRLSSEVAFVKGDEKRLVQVVVNLLTNAAKYTHENGVIEMCLEIEARQVVMSVRDNGIGLSKDLLPRVFDLFVQGERSADRREGGLGLGLALVKSLVELHGGQVTANSAGHGEGSVFTVSFPRYDFGQMTGYPESNLAGATVVSPSRKIMIVDDNIDAATAIGMLLEAMGHEVHIENDPASALNSAPLFRPDIFLLDIGMPGMDGNELAARLRTTPEVGNALLIAVSGYAQEKDKKATVSAGFDHHYSKPLDMKNLELILNAYTSNENADHKNTSHQVVKEHFAKKQ